MKPTDEHVEIFKTMWLQRSSAGDIVRHFGGAFTRSQVLGKIYRMGLMRTKNPHVIRENRQRIRRARMLEDATPRIAIRNGRNGKLRVVPAVRSDGMPFAPPLPMPSPSEIARRSFNGVSGPSYGLGDLNLFDCHWPIGDPQEKGFCYCAAPVVKLGPYCHHHARIAYNAPVRR